MNLNSNPAYAILDGFLLKTSLRPNLTFLSMAVKEMEAVRRAGSYRTRSWVVPESPSLAVPANDSIERQVYMKPKSIIWGYTFTAIQNNGTSFAGPFSFTVQESCTDVPLLSEVVRTDKFTHNKQYIFARPLIIPEPGLVNVTICSQQSSDAAGAQLVLWGGEPVCV